MHIFNLPSTVIFFSLSHTFIHSTLANPIPRQQVDFDQPGAYLPPAKMATGTNLGGGVSVNKQQQLGPTPATMAIGTTQQRPSAQNKLPPAGLQSQKTTTVTPAKGGMSQPPTTRLSPIPDVTDLRKELVIDPGIFKSMYYHPKPNAMFREMPVMFITHIRGLEPKKEFSDPADLMTNDQVVNKFRGSDFRLPPELIPKLNYYKIETSTIPSSAGGVKGRSVYSLVDLDSQMRKVVGAELALDPEDVIIASDMILVDVELKADTMGKMVGDMGRGIRKATTWR
ncbi:hypothetical protein PspLS_01850 [Pyricularia sp. CBS 133598]|nr:hypothetical protein PspLS_01850 [Pyricularia sp. CBS 133598]